MAGLEVQIGADKSDFDKKIKEVEFDVKQLAKEKQAQIKLGLDTKEITANIKDAKKSLLDLKNTAKDAGNSMAKDFTPKVANGGNTLMQFSRIAQDAPFGIIGIGNNLTATAESFSYLSKSAGGTGNALKAVASSLLGTGGILLAVSLVTTALTYMSQNGITVSDVFKKLTGDFDSYADALKKVNEAVYSDKGVQSAIANVNELTINIDLAKKGFLDKEQVVKQYNETIGKTTGLVSTLDEAEKQITKNGDAYIKMTLYKAAANLALEEAGKAALNAEKSRIKNLTEFTNAFLDADLTQTRSKEQYEAKQRNLQNQAKKRRAAEVKINQDAADQNVSIAKKFQQQAAKIATEFNFNLFNDTKAPSTKTGTKKAEPVYSTPQVSPVESSINATGLAETSGMVLQIAKNVQGAEGMITTSMGNINVAFDASGAYMLEILQALNDDMNDLIQGSIVNTFSSLGDAIGGALAGGGNVLKAVGQSLLQSLGGFLSDMGGLLIKYGTLAVLKGKLDLAILTGGPVSIAAGVAAIAVGVALKAAGGAIGQASSSGGSGGGRSVSTGNSISSPTSSTGGGGGSSFQGGTVVFEISGQSLIGVLGNTLDKNRRLGGSLGLG